MRTNSTTKTCEEGEEKSESESVKNWKEKEKNNNLCNVSGIIALTLFFTVGPSLIFINKELLSYRNTTFPYPLILSSLGVLTSGIVIHSLVYIGIIEIRSEIRELVTFSFLIKNNGLISLLHALTLLCGNNVYYYLSVSLIQMLKSFTPVLTMFLLFLTKQESINNYLLIISILLISFGTLITTFGVSKQDSSLIGLLFMLGSESTEALKITLNQKLLQGIAIANNHNGNNSDNDDNDERVPFTNNNVDNNETENENEIQKIQFTVVEGLYYYAPLTFFFMCILALPLEIGNFLQNIANVHKCLKENWYFFIMAAILGFVLNFVSFFVTKLIGALYLKAVNIVRSICLVIVAAIIFPDTVITKQEMFGYLVSLTGFCLYNYVKMKK